MKETNKYSKTYLHDMRISLGSKGLLGTILYYNIKNFNELIDKTTDSADEILKVLLELDQYNYINYNPINSSIELITTEQ